MIQILTEESFSNSVWCRSLVAGLVAELKLKRLDFAFISSAQELAAGGDVYIIASSRGWVQAVLQACRLRQCRPVLLCNQAFQDPEPLCSTVCSDIHGSMAHLVEVLRRSGRGRIALYGVNPNSASDASHRSGFLAAVDGKQDDVFINNGSLERCYADFRGNVDRYDAVICTNDFAAVSLVRRLLEEAPQELERLVVIGCAETRLTEFYREHMISLRVNHRQFGRAAVTLLENLRRNEYLSQIAMSIRCDFAPLAELSALAPPAENAVAPVRIPPARDLFYEDRELDDMLRVERLLSECDETDRTIIAGMLRGEAYEKIAEHCFVTVSTVKYRVRKMLSVGRMSGRAELVRLAGKYLRPPHKNERGERI